MNINIEQRIKALNELGLVFVPGAYQDSDGYERGEILVSHNNIAAITDDEFVALVLQVKEFMLANPTDYPLGEQSQELTIVDRASQTLLSGGQLLKNIQLKTSGYISKVQQLKADIAANGGKLNVDLDARANKALLVLKPAVDEIDGESKEIRQAMTMIRDQFLACPKSIQAEIDVIQAFRNDQAVKQKAENDRLKKEEEAKAAHRNEVISVRALVEKALITYFSEHLLSKKQAVNNWFNSITLENFDQRESSLNESVPKYDPIHFKTFTYRYTGNILKGEEVTALIEEVRTDAKCAEFADQYLNEMLELRAEKRDLLPSKKLELERIAEFEREQERERQEQIRIENERKTANEERRKELEKQQAESEARQREAREKELEETRLREEREKEEAEATRLENEKAAAAQASQVDVSAAQAATISMFEQTTNSTPTPVGGKSKTVLKATITNQVGIYPIFQLWMDDIGMKMSAADLMDEFSKMFTHASKKANAKVPLMIENEFVTYIEETKAVTSKKKEAEAV